MSVFHGPDDVLRSPGGIAAEEHVGARRLERCLVHHWHVPLVERDADVALDPREGVVLTDGEDDRVARHDDRLNHRAGLTPVRRGPLQPLELHADELAVFDHEALRRVILDDVDAFFLGILELPWRRFEKFASATRDHVGVGATEPARRAAAIHGGVAHADDEYLLANRLDMAEVHRAEPLDADVDLVAHGRVPSSRNVELFALGGAAAHEDGVVLLIEQRAQARYRRVVPDLGAHVDDALRLLIEHLLGETERRNVHAHQATRLRVLFVDHDLVAERQEVVRYGERRWAGADERDALAVAVGDRLREIGADVVAQIGGHALETADGDGRAVNATASAGGLAGAIAGSSQNAGKDVGLAVEQIRFRVPSLRDEPEVFRDVRVRGAGPLAVHYLVVVVGRAHIRVQSHSASSRGKARPISRWSPIRRTNTEAPWESMRHIPPVRHADARGPRCVLFAPPSRRAVASGDRHQTAPHVYTAG